jgi:hypothetical protein
LKIVINKCYGGFGLSPRALKRYYELKGRECHFFKQDPLYSGPYTEISMKEAADDIGITAYDVKDPNALKDEKDFINTHFLSYYDIERNDPDLVKVVEELGRKADGSCAELEVVEIPDDVKWELDDYDGIETIHEQHRSWG